MNGYGSVSVKEYGAVGDQTNDTRAFQQAFENERNIYIPRGVYEIHETIRVYAYTSVRMDNEAVILWRGRANRCVFLNGEYGNTSIRGYSGDGNIYFYGGTINLGNIPSGATGYGPIACGWGHAENIHMESVKFTGGYNNHYVDMTAVRRSSYINCVFEDMVITGGNLYEALQIDMSTESAFPHFGYADNMPSYDCIVDRCTFRNLAMGVGSHASRVVNGQQVLYESVRITNNSFYNMKDCAIRMDSYRGAHIDGNYIQGSSQHGIYVIGGRSNYIGANYVADITEHGICLVQKGISGTNYPPVDSIIKDARIINCGRSAVRVVNGERIDIVNIKSTNTGEDGLSATTGRDIRILQCFIRNASTAQNGSHNGIRLSGIIGGEISGSDISNQGYSTNYSNGIYIPDTNRNINTYENKISRGTSGRVNIAVTNGNRVDGETFLTGQISVDQIGQTIRLSEDINNFSSIIVGSGIVGRNTFSHGLTRGFFDRGFRRGEDTINVTSSSGKILLNVISPTELRVVQADDPVRVILGLR